MSLPKKSVPLNRLNQIVLCGIAATWLTRWRCERPNAAARGVPGEVQSREGGTAVLQLYTCCTFKLQTHRCSYALIKRDPRCFYVYVHTHPLSLSLSHTHTAHSTVHARAETKGFFSMHNGTNRSPYTMASTRNLR